MKQTTHHCRECNIEAEEFCPEHPNAIIDSIVSEVPDKHYVYGSGMAGCLYDYGPHFCETIEGAISDFEFIFGDCIEAEELIEMANNLRGNGGHKFRDPHTAGAQYCEVSESSGPMPENTEQ